MKLYPINRNFKDIDLSLDPFEQFFRPLFYDEKFDAMKTDIKETEENYILEIELPGYNKEDITVDYENEYVTVTATKKAQDEKEEKKDSYIRKERSVRCQRSYYVGDIDENLISAKLEQGILTLAIPKALRAKPQKKGIVIA